MNLDIIFLSFIQGISEILPISSSVNLHLFSSIFHINSFSFSLKIALHAGSFLTLLIYFRKEIIKIIKGLFGKKIRLSDTYFFALVFGTSPVVILGFFARDFVKEFDSSAFMGISSILFGILLFIFDKISSNKNKVYKAPISIPKSFIIGIFQSVAIFPGVSRLGICITSSRMLNIDRKKAISFSLFLAIPSICGSLVLELINYYKGNFTNSFYSADFIKGTLFTMIIGTIFINPLVKYMERKGFKILAVYRVIIGLIIYFI